MDGGFSGEQTLAAGSAASPSAASSEKATRGEVKSEGGEGKGDKMGDFGKGRVTYG